jgi:hypothetical protein
MIDLLLVSLAKVVISPVETLPVPLNPADWGSSVGIVTDDLGENIYFAGGNTVAASANRRVMSYNIASKLYTEYPPLPGTVTPTNYFQIWCKSGTIYINRSGAMYRLNSGESAWTKLANPSNPNNMPSYGGATLVYNGRLLCYGLLNAPDYLNAICEYIPESNSFVRVGINPLKPIMTYTGLGRLGTKFYMINNTNHLDVYDIVTNTWSVTANIPVTYYTRALVAYDDRVVLFGGNTSTFELTYSYIPTTGQFKPLPPLRLSDSNSLFVSAGEYAYSLQPGGKLISYKL